MDNVLSFVSDSDDDDDGFDEVNWMSPPHKSQSKHASNPVGSETLHRRETTQSESKPSKIIQIKRKKQTKIERTHKSKASKRKKFKPPKILKMNTGVGTNITNKMNKTITRKRKKAFKPPRKINKVIETENESDSNNTNNAIKIDSNTV
eukprot:307632_1